MEDKSRIWGISDVKAFLISIITGFILLTIVAVIFTEISNETVNKTADRVLDFVQTRVNTYEYFIQNDKVKSCLLYTSPSPRDLSTSRMPSSA